MYSVYTEKNHSSLTKTLIGEFKDYDEAMDCAENAVEGAANGIANGVKGATNSVENKANDLMNDIRSNGDNHNTAKDTNNETRTTTNSMTGNYTATRTNAEGSTLMGMNATTWTWLIIGIAAIAIVALVWYYSMQMRSSNYDDKD